MAISAKRLAARPKLREMISLTDTEKDQNGEATEDGVDVAHTWSSRS